MERKRFAYALALSMALVLLFGRLDVYVPVAEKDSLKVTLQKTLTAMPCDKSAEFIEENFLSSKSKMTKRIIEAAAKAKAGTCEQEKEFIFGYVSQQLSDVSQVHVGTKSWFSFPPAACLSCASSLCLARERCAKCCRKHHTTFCYECD